MMLSISQRLELYRKLYLIRQSEKYIVEHYHEDMMKTPMHMSMGQEAIAVGVLAAVGDRAQVFTSYRTHAAYLARTDDVEGFFAELYGRVTGPSRGKAGSMHIANPEAGFLLASGIVGAQIPIAVGAALANKMRGTEKIAVVFFGDGATNEGAFWESLNLACLYELPILFVCEDNGFAVHTRRRDRQGYKDICDVLDPFYCLVYDTIDAEGVDVEQVCELAKSALWFVNRNTPAFLHLRCYRWLEHVGIDEDYGVYRERSELEEWQKRDPVAMQRARLMIVHPQGVVSLERTVDRRIAAAVQAARVAVGPEACEVAEGVFVPRDKKNRRACDEQSF